MYQPKIRDDLISRLYHLAKARKIPMTRLINHLLEQCLKELAQSADNVHEAPAREYQGNRRRKGGRDGHTPRA